MDARARILLPALLSVAVFAGEAGAQAWTPAKGHGSASVAWQQLRITRHTLGNGDTQDIGEITDRALYLRVDYGLSDRWAVHVQAPFRSNRYQGDDPHDPRIFPGSAGQRFLDDGHFHSGWGDWSVGTRYRLTRGALNITPFASFSWPGHDYSFFAESALGTHQRRLDVGVNVTGPIGTGAHDLYWLAGVSYARMQPKLHRRVDHAYANLELGGALTPRLSAFVALEHEESLGGVDAPQGFFNADGSFNPEIFLYHDALLDVAYTKMSVGGAWRVGTRNRLFASVGRTLHGEDVHLIDRALTVGLQRDF